MRTDPATWPEVARSGFAEWGTKQGDACSVDTWGEGPALFDMADLNEESITGASAAGGAASVRYVKQAVGLVRFHAAAAVVTAPLSKAAVRLAGLGYPGHTELLADLCGIDRTDVAMLLVSPDFKVALMSVHVGLKEAIASLSRDALVARLALVWSEHRRWFGAAPRVGLCALNPHGGEEGLFGREEMDLLAPAVTEARAAGIDVRGPFPADTIFVRAARGDFDVVLALYHDQATIALKTRSFGRSVNMTLGLPLLRTSVDHGTAYDIAGCGVADPGSLIAALRLAARLVGRNGEAA